MDAIDVNVILQNAKPPVINTFRMRHCSEKGLLNIMLTTDSRNAPNKKSDNDRTTYNNFIPRLSVEFVAYSSRKIPFAKIIKSETTRDVIYEPVRLIFASIKIGSILQMVLDLVPFKMLKINIFSD